MSIASTVSISPCCKESNSCLLSTRVHSLCCGFCKTVQSLLAVDQELFDHCRNDLTWNRLIHCMAQNFSLLVLRVLQGQRSLLVHQTTSIAPSWNYGFWLNVCQHAKTSYQVHTCVVMCRICLTVNHPSLSPILIPLPKGGITAAVATCTAVNKMVMFVHVKQVYSISRLGGGLLPSPWHLLSHLSVQETFQRTAKKSVIASRISGELFCKQDLN